MPLPTLDELRAHAQELADELTELRAVEEPTEEQVARLDEIVAEIPGLRSNIERTEARNRAADEVRDLATRPGHTDNERRAPVPGTAERNIYDIAEARFASDSPQAFETELRSRARQAIEEAPRS